MVSAVSRFCWGVRAQIRAVPSPARREVTYYRGFAGLCVHKSVPQGFAGLSVHKVLAAHTVYQKPVNDTNTPNRRNNPEFISSTRMHQSQRIGKAEASLFFLRIILHIW